MYKIIIITTILGILISICIYLSKRAKRKPKDLNKISSGDRSSFGTFEEHEGKSPSDKREEE